MLDEIKKTVTISTRVVFDIATMEVVERDSYEYSGPLALCVGVTGTGIHSPSAFLQNTLDAISQKKIAPFISDIVLNPSPTYWAFQRSGKHVTGAELVFPLMTQEEMTGGEFWGDQPLNTATVDSIQPANQVWRAMYQSCAIPTMDIILGSAGASAIDVVKAKMQTCAASLLPKLARSVYGIAPNNTAISIDNLVQWIGTQNNTIAGINRAVTTAWNPGAPVSAGLGHLNPSTFEQAYQSITFGYDEPDTLILNNADYGNFKVTWTQPGTTTTSIIRANDNAADREPQQVSLRYHFRVDNCTVLADQYNPVGTGYMWNSKYFWMNYHSRGYFIIRPWLMATNQEVVVSRVVVVYQLTNVNPRTACAITNIA